MSLAKIGAVHPTRAWLTRLPVPAALVVVTMVAFGIRPLSLGVLAFALVSGELVRIDVAEHRLPNRLVLPLYPAVLCALVLEWLLTGAGPIPAVAAGAGVFLFLLLLSVAGGMGMGDVKLGAAIGLCLGGLGPLWAVAGLVIAFVLGAIGGLVALTRRDSMSGPGGWTRSIPFGPFLLAGFWVTVVGVGIVAG